MTLGDFGIERFTVANCADQVAEMIGVVPFPVVFEPLLALGMNDSIGVAVNDQLPLVTEKLNSEALAFGGVRMAAVALP